MLPAKFRDECYQVYKKYQIAIHKDEPSEISEKSYTNFLCKSPLIHTVIMVANCGSLFLHSLNSLNKMTKNKALRLSVVMDLFINSTVLTEYYLQSAL